MLNTEEKRIIKSYINPLLDSLEDWYNDNVFKFKDLIDNDYPKALDLLSEVRNKAQEIKKFVDLLHFGKYVKHQTHQQKSERYSKQLEKEKEIELKGFKDGVKKQKEMNL